MLRGNGTYQIILVSPVGPGELCTIAESDPHAVYIAYVHDFQHKFTYYFTSSKSPDYTGIYKILLAT
jgi:hypothetical protein